MCLFYNKDRTTKFKKRNKYKKFVTVWKIYRKLNDGDYQSIMFPGKNNIKKNSVVVSDRYGQKAGSDVMDTFYYGDRCIWRGIHVFLNRRLARSYLQYHKNMPRPFSSEILEFKVVKCRAKIQDLVCCNGWGEAVFMKIKVGYNEKEGPE